MANDVESAPGSSRELFGGTAPDRYLGAAEAVRFVLDGAGRFALADPEFESYYGATIARGDAFDSNQILPSRPVQTAIEAALQNQNPERRLVLFPKAIDRDSVWIFEAIPFEAPQLADGMGVAGVFVRCDEPSGRTSLDEMLFSVTLAERLARERLGTAKAVVATIRHEISNALTTIIGNAELMLRKTPVTEVATTERMHEILSQGRRIQLVIEKLDALTDVRTKKHYGGYELLELELNVDADPEKGE